MEYCFKTHFIYEDLLKDNNLNRRIEILKSKIKDKEIIGNQLIELIDDNTIIEKIHKTQNKIIGILKKVYLIRFSLTGAIFNEFKNCFCGR